MGADITFYKGQDDNFYFRDSYNHTNLAWVIGLSYWQVHKRGKKKYIDFFNKLAKITDEQIRDRVKCLFTEKRNEIANGEKEKDWIRMFKKKRDMIRKHLNLINKCDRVSWFV